MNKKLVTCVALMVICLGFSVDALSQNVTNLEEEKTRLMRDATSDRNVSFSSDIDTHNLLNKIKKMYEQKNTTLSESSDPRATTWFSKDPADLEPLRGTQWKFYYMFTAGLQTDTITFSSSVVTATDGTVALVCVNQSGKSGAVFYTEFPAALGGGRGFSALIDWDPVDILNFYFFKVSGNSASGYYIFKIFGTTSKTYSMTGTKVGGTTTTKPTVTTGSATFITSTSAILNGKVNPNGSSTEAYFEYGTTTNYGLYTAFENIGSGSSLVTVSTTITDLIPDTTYHYRLTATNSVGTSFGTDMVFGQAVVYVSSDGTCGGNTPCYSTIQEAIDIESSGTTIQIVAGSYDEDVTLNTPKNLTLSGGWNSSFTARSSTSSINSMAINAGTITVDELVIQ